jgi:hypothetical protein
MNSHSDLYIALLNTHRRYLRRGGLTFKAWEPPPSASDGIGARIYVYRYEPHTPHYPTTRVTRLGYWYRRATGWGWAGTDNGHRSARLALGWEMGDCT